MTVLRNLDRIHFKYRAQVTGILVLLLFGILYFNSVSNNYSDVSKHQFIQSSDSEDMIRELKANHLTPPSTKPYNLTPADAYENTVWHDEVSQYVMEVLKNKKSGFFIECGANDGEFLSNTLRLEKDYGWTGLLVEADPKPFEVLKTVRNRKAWLADVCLATQPTRQTIEMRRHKSWNGMSYNPAFVKDGSRSEKDFTGTFVAQCFPLVTILAALDVKEVDYFSLDVEGAELAILKSFPFNDGSVVIKVISVEVQDVAGLAAELKALMAANKYRLGKYIEAPYIHDFVFLHESVPP